jgi:hypothetical protein
MGASGWTYFFPYQPDIQKAFEELQAEVFQSGDYSSLWTKAEAIRHYKKKIAEALDEDEYIREEFIEDLTASLNRITSLPEPTSISERIEEVRVVNAPEGTHSILDMRGIADQPNYMRVAPLSDGELHSLFGTTQPTREDVERILTSIFSLRRTWMGTYVIIYKDSDPDEIMFVGTSGD